MLRWRYWIAWTKFQIPRLPKKNALLRLEVAIAAITGSRLKSNAYIKFRNVQIANNVRILPTSKSIPPKILTENTAEITVRDLLKVATARLSKAQNIAPDCQLKTTLLSKWGMDGRGTRDCKLDRAAKRCRNCGSEGHLQADCKKEQRVFAAMKRKEGPPGWLYGMPQVQGSSQINIKNSL